MAGLDHHSLADREYLRTMDTAKLKKLHRNTCRSVVELTNYREALSDVLVERAKEEADAKARQG